MSEQDKKPEIVDVVIAELSEIDDDGSERSLVKRKLNWDSEKKVFEVESEEFADSKFKAIQQEALNQGANPKAATEASGLDIAKFAWEIIKDTKPTTVATGAFTSVLDSQDKDPLHYPYAKDYESKIYHLRYHNIFNMTLAEAKFRVMGTNRAQKPPDSEVPNGNYLPQVCFNFTQCQAAWTWGLNGSANVTGAANVGGPDDINPQILVNAMINSSSILQSFNDSYTFKIQGAKGVI